VVVEGVHNYVAMVNGLTKLTRDKAVSTAKTLLAQAGLQDVAADAQERVATLAEELLQASKANRKLLESMVASEIDKAVSRWGFARQEEVDDLRKQVAELRMAVAYEAAKAESDTPRGGRTPGAKSAASRSSASKSAASKSAASRSVGSKAAASKSAASKAATPKPARRPRKASDTGAGA
jgi:polyhydroxyalkanoate synthesis regulator phasin